MKIYLAGPMRGYKDFNKEAFTAGAQVLRGQGHEVFSPSERDMEVFGTVASENGDEVEFAQRLGMEGLSLARNVFLADTDWICRHAEGIALLPGWNASKGAKAERALAEAIGLEIMYLSPITQTIGYELVRRQEVIS